MELTLDNTQDRRLLKEIFQEIFQENKIFFVEIIREAIGDLNAFQTDPKNNLEHSNDRNAFQPKAGVYYKGGVQVDPYTIDTQNSDKSNSQLMTDPWDSLIESIDDFAVDTGIEDFSSNLDHYLYGHPKRELT